MNFGISHCYYDNETRTLSIFNRFTAWNVRLWPNPEVVHVAGPRSAQSPPLYLELAVAPAPRTPIAVAISLASGFIPDRIRECVVRSAPASEQFPVLQALAAVPALLEVLEDRPVLGRVTGAEMQVSAERVEQLRTALEVASSGRTKRVALLAWLGLPTDASFQRMLARAVAPAAWRPEDLQGLAEWASRAPKLPRHLPALSPGQVRLWQMVDERSLGHLLTHDLLVSLQNHMALPLTGELATALDAIAVDEQGSGRKARAWRSGLDLAQCLLDAVKGSGAALLGGPPREPDGGVPCPLISPTWARPLRTEADFQREGATMHHCIGNGRYFIREATGEGYGFAVAHPSGRLSVWLDATSETGVFSVGEMTGAQNSDVPVEAENAVREWVEEHNRWARYLLHDGPRPVGPAKKLPAVVHRFTTTQSDITDTLVRVGNIASQWASRVEPENPMEDLEPWPPQDLYSSPMTLEQEVRAALRPLRTQW